MLLSSLKKSPFSFRVSFFVTLCLVFLPTIFNLFELLRFRLVSRWIEEHFLTTTTTATTATTADQISVTEQEQLNHAHPNNNDNEENLGQRDDPLRMLAVFVAKSISNFFLLLSWLSVALLRWGTIHKLPNSIVGILRPHPQWAEMNFFAHLDLYFAIKNTSNTQDNTCVAFGLIRNCSGNR